MIGNFSFHRQIIIMYRLKEKKDRMNRKGERREHVEKVII